MDGDRILDRMNREPNRHRDAPERFRCGVYRPVNRGGGCVAPHLQAYQPPSEFRVAGIPGLKVGAEIEKCSPRGPNVRNTKPCPELSPPEWRRGKFERHAQDNRFVAGVRHSLVEWRAMAFVRDLRSFDWNEAEEKFRLLDLARANCGR